jgi:chaperonin GroEL
MIPKHVYLGNSGREKLQAGIRKLAGAVKSTLGPYGRPVIMESDSHVGGKTITKDGVSVAKAINLYDPVENLAVSIVKEAANQTATVAGDGTTTSIVLTEAILDQSNLELTEQSNVTSVTKHMKDLTETICNNLDKRSKAVTKRRLKDVATISANNDKELGSVIADVFSKVKVVSVEMSKTPSTYTEVIDGMKFDRGYTSPVMITNHDRETCELTNPYVLLTDIEITNIMALEHILKPILQDQSSLLIIGNMSNQARETFNFNIANGRIKGAHVTPPNFGYRQKEMMKDLEAALGGKFYSDDQGDGMHNISFEDLGRASKVVISRDRTILYRHPNVDRSELDTRLEELRSRIDSEMSLSERRDTEARIANIDGGVGIIYVGAESDIEAKEKFDRVDDAVRAVGAAMEEGILPGGGVALLWEASHLAPSDNDNADMTSAKNIIRLALESPIRQILTNAGMCDLHISDIAWNENYGYGMNVKTGEFGDMMKMGVIDPTLVTKSALKNAVSVATTIMMSQVIVTNMREGDAS